MSETITEADRHNAYAWVKPDAAKCYLCNKAEFATPVDGFQVQNCDKCARPVCQSCAETDYDAQGDPSEFINTQWQCEQECLVDVRVPVTVTFDFSIENVKPDEVEFVIRQLEDAVIKARMENLVDIADLASGTRWTPADADMDNVGIRTHARSGSFAPWKRKATEGAAPSFGLNAG